LAVRGRGRGWRFVTEPKSVVRHVHSASTVEGSAIAEHYIERNRLLVVLRHASVSDILRVFIRHLLVTASYLRSACVGALPRWQRPDLTRVHRRSASFLAALRLLPRSLSSRRKIASNRLLSRDELAGELGFGSGDSPA
jgi:GT2 family glycosyltransferase